MPKQVNDKNGIIVYAYTKEEKVQLENNDLLDLLLLTLTEKQKRAFIKYLGKERFMERLIVAQNKFKSVN